MNSESTLINRVAGSGLVTLKLEEYFPKQEIVNFDLKPFLFRELILRELDFRQAMKDLDWMAHQHKILAVHCSNDAIIPTWAFMLVAQHASAHGIPAVYGNADEVLRILYHQTLKSMDWTRFEGAKVVIKDCSDLPVPQSAYLLATELLLPHAVSIMYGEPCSTVPVYKKPKKSIE